MAEATPKTTNAAIRDAVPPASKNSTNTGTRANLSIVSPFARLTNLGAAGELPASGLPRGGDPPEPPARLVNSVGLPGTSLFFLVDQTRHQVHPL